MDDLRSLLASQDIRDAVRDRRYGVVLRRARQARGLTQAEAGRLAGYSTATISRFETGARRLADIDTLRRLAESLGTAPEVFGLTRPRGECPVSARAATVPDGARLATVVTGLPQDGDEEDMRRRELLAGTAALAGAAALGSARRSTPGPAVGLEDVLYSRAEAMPVPLAGLRDSLSSARDDFRAARYDRLPATLPRIIATARATSDSADSSEQADASTLLADAFILAADFAVKLNDDPLAWMTADRALQAAQAGNDPLTLADARRAVATAMRRTSPGQGRRPAGPRLPRHRCRSAWRGRTRHVRDAAQRRRLHCRHRREPPRRQNTSKKPPRPPPGSVPASPAPARIRASRGYPLPGQHRASPRRQRDRHRARQETAARQHPDRRTPGSLLGRCRSRLPPMGEARSLLRRAGRRRARRPR